MSTIPAFTFGGITRPALILDPSGNIILDPAAQAFLDTYGTKALYAGVPPGTHFPPIPDLLTTPVDNNAAANNVAEGAAVNTLVGITASSQSLLPFSITYSLSADSSSGGFKIDPNTGVVSVANPAKIDFESSPGHAYTVTVQATDGIFTSSQNFTIGVSDVAPSTPVDGNAAANTVAEGAAVGTAVGVTAHSTDINGGTVTYSLTGDTSGGGFTVNAATGVVTVADSTKIDYETAPGHAYSVTVQASDGTLTSTTQTFTIAVSDVPLPTPADTNPAANQVAEGAAAGTLVGLTATANDPNGPTTTYSLIGDTSGGGFTINAATGVVTVADPTKIDFESAGGHAYSVTVKADDGLTSTTQAFTIAVTDVAPSAPIDSDGTANTIVEGAGNGSTVGLTVHSTDINGGTITYSLTADASGGGFTIDPNTGVVTVADSTKIDFETAAGHAYSVTVQAGDGTLTTPQTFTIAVTDVAPSTPVDSNAAANTVAEGAANGSTVGLTAHSSDINGGTVTYSLTADSSGGGFAIDPNTGVVTVADPTKIDYESAPGHAYSVAVQSSDGTLTNSQSFSIAVSDVAPSTPVDSDAAANTVAEGAANGSTVGLTAHSSDINGGTVTYSLTADSSGGGFTIDPTTGAVTVVDSSKIDFESSGGSYTIVAQSNDGTLTNSQAFVIAVSDVAPSAPVDSDAAANQVAVGAPAGTHVGVTASSTDVNGPAVTYSLVGDTSGGGFTINSATGVVTVADPSKIVFNPGSPSFHVTVDSSDGTLHNQQTFTIGVILDAAPVVTAGHTLAYTENQAATAIDPAVTVTDSDNATLAHATVQISGNYVIGEDVLGFTTQNGITGSFNAATGTMTLTGSASVANYQTALESVTYFDNSDNPSGLARTVTILANDGTLDSAPATDTINVTPVNDPPVVTAGHTLNYTENQAATAFDPAITVSDVDNTTLASATVQITGNYVNGEDVLGFTTQNGITGSFNAATGTLTLTGSSSVANYQTALDSVTYFDNSENPSGLARTVTIVTNDGTANSVAKTDTINVTPVNDAPVTTAGGSLNYTENQAATAIDASVTVSDVDSANMSSATIQITGNYVNGQDILGFTNQNGITGSFNAATGTETLTGSSSVANYKTALDSVTYFNNSDNPSGLDRTVSYTVNDGSLNSNTSTSTVHVTPVNDPPVVTFGAITGFTEPPNGTPAASSVPITVAPSLTISDVDSTNLTSAVFELNNLEPSDALSVSGHAGPSGNIGNIHFDIVTNIGGGSTSQTVTFTGTDTIAHYNAVLDLVQFNNTSENPDTTARSYTVTAVDDGNTLNGGNNTGSATTTETVTAVDDPPTASVPTDASLGTAFSHTNFAISGLSVADIDAGSGNVTATIATSHAGLTFDTTGLASFTNNGSHTVTLTGTIAQVNTALGTLVYNSDDGFSGADTVTLNVNDNGHTGTGGPLSSGNQTFHVGVVPQVFYIDNTNSGPGNGAGTQADPFHSIAAFNTASPAGTGDYVVLEHGTGTYSEANGINLANGVNLIGGSQTLQFTNPVTNQVVTANVGSGTDPLIKLTAGSTDNAIDLLAGTTGHTIAHVNVDTTLGTGMGISDDGNNVGTVAISNMLVNTASGTGISFTHGGTVGTTGTNSISSTSGTALDVENTTISSSNLTFQSISSGSASNSSGDGIILVNTGSTGGLHVTGVGTTASSGGTIQHKTGADGSSSQGSGIFLNNTKDVELADMQLNGFDNFAIRGNSVTGFTLDHTVINGDSGTSNSFIDPLVTNFNTGEDAIRFTNLLGSGSITNSNISGGYTNTIMVENNTGTLNRLTIDHSTIGGRTDNGTGMNDGINFQADTGSTAMNLTVTNSALTTARAALIAVTNQVGTNTDVVFDNNTLTNNHPLTVSGGPGLDFAGLGNMTFDISNNTFDMHAANGGTGIKSHVIEVNKGSGSGNSTFDGTISGNTIGVAATAHSGSGAASNDIDINSQDNGTFTVAVLNNTLTHYDTAGIQITQGPGSSTVNATVQGNVTSNPDTNGFAGLYVVAGVGLAGDHGVVNLLAGGSGTQRNDFSNGDPTNTDDVFLQASTPGTSVINLSKGVSVAATANQVIKDNNLNPGATTEFDSGTINLVAGNPPLPLLAAPGGVQASSPTSGEMHLTQSELDSVVAAAIAEWAAAGASASQLAALHATTFSIADLSGSIIGDETSPAHITIDTDAAGHGWFIDPTPSDNSEFTHAVNAAGTDLLTDPANAAAGHLDLLTTVVHEMGHVLGLPDSNSASAVNDLMYISLVDGERRLPDSADVVQANNASSFSFQAVGTSAPAPTPGGSAGAPVVTAAPILDAGHGGGTLVGTAGADNFVFANVDVHGSAAPPITHVANYSFAQGDTFDFSALTSQLHGSGVSDALVVRAIEGPGGSFATLQVNTADSSMGSKVGSNWVSVAEIDGAHIGDTVNVLIDSNAAVHLAQIHVGLLV